MLKADAIRCPDDGATSELVETLPAGIRLGAYRIDRVLGEGGMGFVYAATHETLNRPVAIKMLRPELASNAQIVTRFLNEAKAANVIAHPNIVSITDYGDGGDGNVYFVMEFLSGETLDDMMRKRQVMQLPLLLHVFSQLGKALGAAHAKQIVHRDLKPANVFITIREDNPCFVKLLDFGIAQLRGAGAVQGLTVAGSVMGTPQYMSPEQVMGGTIDARTDVWSMGVMMYRAATGQSPFKGEEFAQLADQILHYPPQPAGELAAMPASLSRLIMSCLERKLESRCLSIGELMAGLERVRQEHRLGEEEILDAVAADMAAHSGDMPQELRDRTRTRDSLRGSLPRYQGGAGNARSAGAGPAPHKPRLGVYVAVAAGVVALAAGGYLAFGREKVGASAIAPADKRPGDGTSAPGPDAPTAAAVPPPRQDPDAPSDAIQRAFAAGDLAKARELAEQDLRATLTSGSLQHQGFAVEALELVRRPEGVPLLYVALKGQPAVRVKAANALGELRLPEAAAKVREALSQSGDKLKVELAAVLYRLGDKDAGAILKRAAEENATRLLAAAAMAEAGDDGGRAVLADVLGTATPERELWWRAAAALLKLGDAEIRKQLQAELAQPAANRVVAAADLLARAGDDKARSLLARVAADPEFPRRGDASLALARLDDARALDWVAEGLDSTDTLERRQALAICGSLSAGAAKHGAAIAALTATDPDLRVRMTAEAVILGMAGTGGTR